VRSVHYFELACRRIFIIAFRIIVQIFSIADIVIIRGGTICKNDVKEIKKNIQNRNKKKLIN